ncbi:MAG TPA: TonB-dependent receptor [Kofleriaceae bacterium]|nr:TonB-dependent receptor [Kofleriaceae bacterium]
MSAGRARRARSARAALACAAGLVAWLGAARSWAQPPPGAVGGGQPNEIEAGKLSKVPKQTKFVEAEYPKDAFDKGIEADVILLLDISAEGKVESVGIAQPAEPPGMGFDEAAMVAAQQFEFTPAEMNGKPIAVQITYRYRFTIKARTAPGETPAAGGPGTATRPTAPARKPTVNFAGDLIERGTRQPLAGVVVTVFRDDGEKATGFEAPTDAAGHFEFFDLAPGSWKVLADPPGYYPFRTTETITAGQRIDATYHVERASYNPYDVTVTAARPRKEVSRTVLSADEIDKVPGGAGDPLTVVQNFAGVARSLEGFLVVRGSAPEDSQFFLDGTTIPFIYHFGGLKSVFPIGILESIEFYPGNFSPMYGRATGGIVDVRLKELKPKKVGGYADVSLLDTGVYLEMPLGKKGGLAVAGRRSYIDGVLNLAVPDDAPVSLVTAPVYYDFHLLGNYRPSPAHDLRGFFLFSDDRLEILFDNPTDVDPGFEGNTFSNATTFYRSLLTYRYVPGDRFENTMRVASGRDKISLQGGQLRFDLDIFTTQLRDAATARFGKRFALTAGADVLFSQTDALITLPLPPKEGEPPTDFDIENLVTTDVKDQRALDSAGFVEGEVRVLDDLMLLPGVRLDHFDRTDSYGVQPRLTARWQLSPTLTAKGGVGLFMQEPQLDETNSDFGNPDLEPERALHTSAGVELKPRPWLSFDVTAFYKNLWHLVSPTDRMVMDGGEMRPLLYDNGGTGDVYGAEVVVRHDLNANLTGWVAYTLSRAEREDSDVGDKRLFDFDQTHILTVVASYVLPRNWLVSGRFRLVSGNPNTPVINAVYNAGSDKYDPVFGAVNSDRDRPFHQLDLRIDKRWIYQSWIFGAYLDIQNVYNKANAEGVSYNFDYSESKAETGLPLLTIFGLKAEF